MLTFNRISCLIFLSCFLLGGCSLSSRTTVDTLDANFIQGRSSQNTLGLIHMDWITIKPMKERDKALMAFGLLGGLAAIAAQSAQDAENYDVETVSLALYQKDLRHLKHRLGEQTRFHFIDSDELDKIEPVQFSRDVRSKRFWGRKAPTVDKVKAYFVDKDHNYALYVVNWGGIYENDNSLFVDTTWWVFDKRGKEVVSMFTRNVGIKVNKDTIQPSELVQDLSKLFMKNLEEFVRVLNGEKPTKT